MEWKTVVLCFASHLTNIAQVFSGHPNLEQLPFLYIQGKQHPYLL